MRTQATHRAAAWLAVLGFWPVSGFAEDCRTVADTYARLACFERQVFAPGRAGTASPCFAQESEPQRLACFEGRPPLRPAAITAAATAPQQPTSAPPPSSGTKHNRVEATIGYAQGNYDGTIRSSVSGNQIDAHTDSLLGSDGKMLSVAYWRDGAIGRTVSVGVEYLHFKNEAKLDGTLTFDNLSVGGTTLSGSGTAAARADLRADLGMINLAYRPVLTEGWHPFIGVGLGVGYGEVTVTGELHIAGALEETFHEESIIGAAQAFFGTEVDITDSLYATLGTRFLLITARPAGIDQQFQNLAVNSGLGWRF